MPTIKNREAPQESFMGKIYKAIKGEKVKPASPDVGTGMAARAGAALEQRGKTLKEIVGES